MTAYLARRIVLLIPTLIGVMILVFFLTRVAVRGDTVDILLERSHSADINTAEALRDKLGLNEPWYQQFWSWAGDVVRGDLGTSLVSSRPVSDELAARLPKTLELGLMAMFVALVISVPVGVISAVRADSWLDYILRSASILLLAIPGFWLGTLVITWGSIKLGYTPPLQHIPFSEDPWGNIKQFGLPALLLGLSSGAAIMRMTRTMMLEVMGQDYVRTAWAKGLRERGIVVRHALKNAMIPVITVWGLQAGVVLGGSVIFEQMFVISGVGQYLYDSLRFRDYVAIQGITLVLASIVILLNLIVDVLYAYLDPRIRYA
jgi:peptide/nickel transport system permease protein